MRVSSERTAHLTDVLWQATESAALLALWRLGVFQRLVAGPLPLSELARDVTSPERLRPFLDLAASVGVVSRSGDAYALVPGDEALLAPADPGADVLGGFDLAILARAPELLLEQAGPGAAVTPAIHDQGRLSTDEWRGYLRRWDARVSGLAEEAAHHLADEPFQRLADLGCGSGTFSRALLRAAPASRASLFDSSEDCLSVSRELGEEAGLGERLEFEQADLLSSRVEGPARFDLALMSIFLSGFSPAAARRLIRNAAARLRPGGRLAILEPAISDDRLHPRSVLRFAAYQALQNPTGALHTEAEMKAWASDAGVDFIGSREMQSIHPPHRLSVWRRPT